jgi:hypothetical protein
MTLKLTVGLGIFNTWSLLAASVAYAQPNAAAPAANTAEPAKVEAPTAAPAAPVATAAPDSTGNTEAAAAKEAVAAPGSCRLGAHAGIDPNDAATAASLVCRELPGDAAKSGYAYRVDLDKLGSRIFITLAAESNGSVVDSRRLGLERIEEVPTVAPRLTDALVHRKSMQDTEQVGNLSQTEAESPVRKRGRILTSLGVLGAFAPGLSAISPGFQGAVIYDTPHWVLTGQAHLAFGVGTSEELNMAELGVGPRYMFSAGNSSLFVGGGMGVEILGKSKEVTDNYGYTSQQSKDNAGMSTYAEVGYEAMRLHRNRINVALRADFPLFKVDGDYLVPLSLSTSFVFDGF